MSPTPQRPSDVVVRPFVRDDRDHLAAMVNAHAGAVIPNVSVSTSTLLSRLEHDPSEPIDDPWVIDRRTLVATRGGQTLAAAHLVRYSGASEAPTGLRDHAGIRWFVFWPPASIRPGADQAGRLLMTACVAVLDAWSPTVAFADGSLPVLGVYGLPDAWPHVIGVVESAGFRHEGQTERLLAVSVDRLVALPEPSFAVVRTVGVSGTRFTADVGGFIEVDTDLETVSRTGRLGEWADVGNFVLPDGPRRSEVATGLLAAAGRWLDLGGVRRLLDYAIVARPLRPLPDDDHTGEAWYPFTAISTSRRGWVRREGRTG